ncbi:hypothetical protein PtA15_12A530 [Puccinia triticina]|uniref:Uncharacterized protein n=1 Tax=Puccinia triticina TaxID=208348 RepID=A0ABY7D0V6_9BASI|nr:uncharacterized protein PtA15_12A530 [Puccinia triticina]WAQ90540.1 hypothetical protein PtA15_12A530 [Puccinia triticina]
MGLLVNDNQYNAALAEAALFKTGWGLQLLFAIILVYSPPPFPQKLFKDHFKNLGDDVVLKLATLYGATNPTKEEI